MKTAQATQDVRVHSGDSEPREQEVRLAERIWNAIGKYVTVDRDAIFKDPNWPHLWDKR